MPSRHLFQRIPAADLPVAVSAERCHIVDASGKRYLDGSGGAAVSCLGHGDPAVNAAIRAQLDRLAFVHTSFFSTEPAEELADALAAVAPPGIERVMLVSGGSEAMEAALKLARQYFLETGQPERRHVIARRQSYHGNTLGALAAGGNALRRAPFAPLLAGMSHVAPCYEYRGRAEGETAEQYGLRVADELEAEILRLGPETVMAFVAEPVAGATLGAVPAVAGYFARIRDICDRHGVLLILDEVMCGMGRCGTLFACEADGVAPDIVAIAKGLGGGYQPVGATLCTAAIHEAVASGSGALMHGHTYMAHPVAAAAALAVLRRVTQDGLLARVNAQGETLDAALRDAFGQHAHVGDIRGRGLFRAIELVADRDTKTPFDPALKVNARIKAAAMEEGLLCYPLGGAADGRAGDHVLLAPPYIITDDEIGELVDKLGRSVRRVVG